MVGPLPAHDHKDKRPNIGENEGKNRIENELEEPKLADNHRDKGKATPTRRYEGAQNGTKNKQMQAKEQQFHQNRQDQGKNTPVKNQRDVLLSPEIINNSKPDDENYKIKHKEAPQSKLTPQFAFNVKPPAPAKAPTHAQNQGKNYQRPNQGQTFRPPAPPHQPPASFVKGDTKGQSWNSGNEQSKKPHLKESADRAKLISFLSNSIYSGKRATLAKELDRKEPIKVGSSSSAKPFFFDNSDEFLVIFNEKDHEKLPNSSKTMHIDDILLLNPSRGFSLMYEAMADLQGLIRNYMEVMSLIEGAQVKAPTSIPK